MTSEGFGRLSLNSASSSQAVPWRTSMFQKNFTAEVSDRKGVKVAKVEYKIRRSSGGKAYFHLLLDASSSTRKRVSTADRKRVYEYLFQNFEDLVEGDNSPLQPQDVIYIWTFNWRKTRLCRVEKKDYHAQREAIRAAYKKKVEDHSQQGTRLYDTIVAAMDKIGEQYRANPEADFFLVPFTDGVDHGSEKSLHDVMDRINFIDARLHTIFITANSSHNRELYKRLETQKEIWHIKIENTEPAEISRGFKTLRHLMFKAFLIVFDRNGGKTRVGVYADTIQGVAESIMADVRSAGCNMIDHYYEMKRIQGPRK